MATVLGLSFDYHDAAAALVRDGALVAAVAEERLSRRKHDAGLPERAVRFCLEHGAPDAVVFYEKPLVKFERILTSALAGAPSTLGPFVRAMPSWMTEKLWVSDRIRRLVGPGPRILFSEHHLSHAASAFLPSPFERAAVLTLDGVGEWETAASGVGEGNSVRLDRSARFPHSLGLFYSALTAYLGFRVNDDEWKVMGLAPYGEPSFAGRLRPLVQVDAEGGLRLDLAFFDHAGPARRGFSPRMEALLGFPPREPESEILDRHRDLARSVQAVTEEAVVAMAEAARARAGTDALCLAGGVALNSVANWRILERTGVRRLFVPPACGDDGGALGAALLASQSLYGDPRGFVLEHAFWGPGVDDAGAERALREAGADFRTLEEPELLDRAARAIASGKVLGWVQGRSEFGPRALGGRSILADPRNPRIKDILNERIKFREGFRPFAPSVTRESAADYFEMPDGLDSPFMLLVPPVRREWRDRLPGITHADGSARVQTVERRLQPRYHALLTAMGGLTGIPVLVNTSFNVRGQPIVNTPREALECFRATGMDALAVGRCWLEK